MIWRQLIGESGDDDEVRKVDGHVQFQLFFMKTTRTYKLLLLCLETVPDRCSK